MQIKVKKKEKEIQEGKVAVWMALHIAEERREAKSKGERERDTQLKAEFQRTARRDQKPFLNEEGKETEVKNGKD